jgi:hypothetical protein
MLSNEQIQENWDKFTAIVEAAAQSSDRWNILHEFYLANEQRFAFMPASGKVSFHSAFPGGHVAHTLRVLETATKLSKLWVELGATVDYSEEELVFSALNHDIGKFGIADAETFIDQDSDWHRKQGEVYKHNPNLPFMKDYDRSLFLLQDLGVKMTENEYLAIKLQSGLYEESNKSYLIAYKPEFRLRSNLPYIIHQADAMSARIECLADSVPTPTVKKAYTKYPAKAPKIAKAASSKFSKYID